MTGLRQPLGRLLIEAARRGFQMAGVDVHRHRPGAKAPDTGAEFFKALITARDRGHSESSVGTEASFIDFCAYRFASSKAQLLQDLFVLHHHGSKRGGFFVEFGATNGVELSNTFLLERDYGWHGIVAEPARCWHGELGVNRKCIISTDCVWHTSGQTLEFNETREKVLSTIHDFSCQDSHRDRRGDGNRYEVSTISLLDLLERNGAPRVIDYLSVDTEGSEFDILNAFDFARYDVRVITVEHNFTPSRQKLQQLLARNGYSRKFEALSQWDDWYVRQDSPAIPGARGR